MINVSDVATGLLGMGLLVGTGVGLVALGGRDRTADQHDVDDYRPEPQMVERTREVVRRLKNVPAVRVDVLPPAPPGTRVPLRLYAEQVVAELMRKRYGTTDHAVIAGRVLREIAVEQRADDLIWTSTAERDLVGAFPVVRAA